MEDKTMTLKKWMASKELTQSKMGDLLGVSRQAVSRYIEGTRVPRKKIMEAIMRITENNVTANDFHNPNE